MSIRARGITRRSLAILAIAAMATMGTMGTSWAQSGRRGGRAPGARALRGGFDGPMKLLRELDLSESQREEVRGLFQDSIARDARRRVAEARRELRDAVESGVDESAVRQRAFELGAAEGDAAVARMRLEAQLQEILTEEQRQKLASLVEERKQEREELRQRFEERRQRRGSREPNP